MRILIIGKDGQLGWELRRSLANLGEIVTTGRHELDLADAMAIHRLLAEVQPRLIVNAAAYTAVDKAEDERDPAFAINGVAPGVLAEEAMRLGAGLVHYSTDYVFDGTAHRPYTEEDATAPLNVYGASKLAGEEAIAGSGAAYLIFRTSWVYSARGKNFFLTMLRLASQQKEVRIVRDQMGAPTWSRNIADATAEVLRQCSDGHGGTGKMFDARGIYNMTAQGSTSWFGFARAILAGLAPEVRVTPILSSEFKTAAKRPAYSVLSGEKLKKTFGVVLPPWDRALQEMIAEGGFAVPVPETAGRWR